MLISQFGINLQRRELQKMNIRKNHEKNEVFICQVILCRFTNDISILVQGGGIVSLEWPRSSIEYPIHNHVTQTMLAVLEQILPSYLVISIMV